MAIRHPPDVWPQHMSEVRGLNDWNGLDWLRHTSQSSAMSLGYDRSEPLLLVGQRCKMVPRFSSREVRMRVPFFLQSILVGEPSRKKKMVKGKPRPSWVRPQKGHSDSFAPGAKKKTNVATRTNPRKQEENTNQPHPTSTGTKLKFARITQPQPKNRPI